MTSIISGKYKLTGTSRFGPLTTSGGGGGGGGGGLPAGAVAAGSNGTYLFPYSPIGSNGFTNDGVNDILSLTYSGFGNSGQLIIAFQTDRAFSIKSSGTFSLSVDPNANSITPASYNIFQNGDVSTPAYQYSNNIGVGRLFFGGSVYSSIADTTFAIGDIIYVAISGETLPFTYTSITFNLQVF